jgi:hypothetical protein
MSVIVKNKAMRRLLKIPATSDVYLLDFGTLMAFLGASGMLPTKCRNAVEIKK